jgi:hypothetical protein
MCKPSSSVEKEASVVGPVPRIVPDHRRSFSLRPVDTKGGASPAGRRHPQLIPTRQTRLAKV